MIAEEPTEEHVKALVCELERVVFRVTWNPYTQNFDATEFGAVWVDSLEYQGAPVPVVTLPIAMRLDYGR